MSWQDPAKDTLCVFFSFFVAFYLCVFWEKGNKGNSWQENKDKIIEFSPRKKIKKKRKWYDMVKMKKKLTNGTDKKKYDVKKAKDEMDAPRTGVFVVG